MKKSELKLWDVFVNNNGHLSIVYAITKNNLYIYNYNGSNYSINKDDTPLTNYKKSNITADDFFINYPMSIRNEWKKEPEYQAIKSRYLSVGISFDFSTFDDSKAETNSNYKLLLII